jgi:hypothetical protein
VIVRAISLAGYHRLVRGTVFMLLVAALACGPAAAPITPAPEVPEAAARLTAASPVAMAADGTTVYYADLDGVWAMSVTGGDARLVSAPDEMVERIVPHGDELLLGDVEEVLAVPITGGTPRVVVEGGAGGFAVDDDGVWFVRGGVLQVVPHAGGEARTVARVVGEVVAPLVVDRDGVYVATAITLDAATAPRMSDDVTAAALWRIAKRDGARVQLAKRQFGVAALARRDDRLYWTSFAAGLRSVPVPGGGTIRTELGGAGVALAADADGVVVETATGYFVEVRREGARLAAGAARQHPEPTPGFVLAGGAVVALVTDLDANASAVWREPRPWRSPITVAGWVTDRIQRLVATGDGGVVVLDAPLDEAAPGRILRIDGNGRRHVVVAGTGLSELAVDGGTIAYRAGDAIWRKDGAAAAAVRAVTLPAKEIVLGLVLAGDRFVWSDTQHVRAAPAHGGAVVTLHQPDHGTLGTRRPHAELVVDGENVYFASLGWGGSGVARVIAIDKSEVLFEADEENGVYAGDPLVRAGDALYTTTSTNEIWRMPLAGGGARLVVPALEDDVLMLAAAGDRLVASLSGDTARVALVEPLRAKVTTLATFDGEYGIELAGAPEGDAVYCGLVTSDLIVRVPLPPT